MWILTAGASGKETGRGRWKALWRCLFTEGPRIPLSLQKKLLHVQQLSLEHWLTFLNCGCDHWNLYLERSGFKCSIFSKSFKIPVLCHRGLGLFYQGIYWNWSTEPYWEPAGVGHLFPTLNLSPFLNLSLLQSVWHSSSALITKSYML